MSGERSAMVRWLTARPRGLDGTHLAVLALFVSQVMVGLSPYRDSTRLEIVRAAAVQIAILVLGCGVLVAQLARGTRPVTIPREDRPVFAILLAWAFVATFAAAEGVLAHHQAGYISGDYYKFLALPIVFGLWYFSVRTEAHLEFMWRALVVLFGVAIVVDMARYYPQLNQVNRFATVAVDQVPMMSPLLLYALYTSGPRLLHTVFVVIFAETLLVLSWAQRLGGFIGYLASAALLLGLGRLLDWTGLRPRRLAVASLVIVATLAFNIWVGDPIRVSITTTGGHLAVHVITGLSYIRSRMLALIGGGAPGDVADEVGGSRGAEVAVILRDIPHRPLLGFGLGGTLRPVPLGVTRFYWDRPKHYIHAGLFEVLYRSGLAGLATLTALFFVIFLRGARLLAGHRHPFGVFVVVNAMVQLILLTFDSSLMFPYVSLALSFAGVSVLERSRGPAPSGRSSSEAGVSPTMSNTVSAGG